MTTTDWTTETTGVGQYADINGLHIYYETWGSGRPLVLLHGGLGSGEMFRPILPALTDRHQVIAPDLQGHGRTADIERPISMEAMADDTAALIGQPRLLEGPTHDEREGETEERVRDGKHPPRSVRETGRIDCLDFAKTPQGTVVGHAQ